LVDFRIAMDNEIPEKFLGSFKLDRSENFDEFLAAKGVNWLLRKMISFASVTKVFSRAEAGRYDLINLSSKKNTSYRNWRLNEQFQSEGFDGKMHNVRFLVCLRVDCFVLTTSLVSNKENALFLQIRFEYDPTTESLKETHVRMNEPNDQPETYTYTVDGDTLVLVRISGTDRRLCG
uniref:FABP domain-containing protein n=1 Tax=Gongylonema pulchrum TaxID=637853 RepID=A0A183EN61_9BILA